MQESLLWRTAPPEENIERIAASVCEYAPGDKRGVGAGGGVMDRAAEVPISDTVNAGACLALLLREPRRTCSGCPASTPCSTTQRRSKDATWRRRWLCGSTVRTQQSSFSALLWAIRSQTRFGRRLKTHQTGTAHPRRSATCRASWSNAAWLSSRRKTPAADRSSAGFRPVRVREKREKRGKVRASEDLTRLSRLWRTSSKGKTQCLTI